jgi:hypothetical protein
VSVPSTSAHWWTSSTSTLRHNQGTAANANEEVTGHIGHNKGANEPPPVDHVFHGQISKPKPPPPVELDENRILDLKLLVKNFSFFEWYALKNALSDQTSPPYFLF